MESGEKVRSSTNKAKVLIWCGLIIAIVLIYSAAKAQQNTAKPVSDTAAPTSTAHDSAQTPMHSHSASTAYQDGTYTASSRYSTPGGGESIKITLTLKDNVITDSSVQQTPKDEEAAEYQAQFKQNYQPLVVGKKITDINLSRVSGSSLTSRGFNDALENIKSQAHRHDS